MPPLPPRDFNVTVCGTENREVPLLRSFQVAALRPWEEYSACIVFKEEIPGFLTGMHCGEFTAAGEQVISYNGLF